jgi:hypothetical protein
VAPKKSYLNDVRIDTRTNTAFITESAKGAIIVVDLKSGKARRLLDGHPSTQPEKDVKLVMDGKALIDQQKKTPPQIASDGIALDAKNGYLYYHALTGHTLYRIKTSFLTDEKLGKRELESKVENVGRRQHPMGCWKRRMAAFILPILKTAQSCVGTLRASASSKLLGTNVCSGRTR